MPTEPGVNDARAAIIPVLDLRGGLVVRGIAGRRDEYRPIESRLTPSCAPVEVAAALVQQLRFDSPPQSAKRPKLYVADLDAIMSDKPQWPVIRALIDAGYDLYLDGGIRDVCQARQFVQLGVHNLIVGLEVVASPDDLAEIVNASTASVGFSLDLKAGAPMTNSGRWPADPIEITDRAVDCGIEFLVILDLASVGVAGGPSTLDLCRRVHERHASLPLITGGGIRSVADVQDCLRAGAQQALVASALHDGMIAFDEGLPPN
jgi:phosphoribosylformimino-5-aminoimidazole carboxamide ribotide isomerase